MDPAVDLGKAITSYMAQGLLCRREDLVMGWGTPAGHC